MQFIKIATLMFPDTNISKIDLNAPTANLNESCVEVFLFGYTDPYQFTGDAARMAADMLQDIKAATAPLVPQKLVVTLDGKEVAVPQVTLIDGTVVPGVVVVEGQNVQVNEIEWVDFASNINGVTGVEFRVSSDPKDVTRKYVGKDVAGRVYDALAPLSGEEIESAGVAGR